jgi:hypothetical protein
MNHHEAQNAKMAGKFLAFMLLFTKGIFLFFPNNLFLLCLCIFSSCFYPVPHRGGWVKDKGAPQKCSNYDATKL